MSRAGKIAALAAIVALVLGATPRAARAQEEAQPSLAYTAIVGFGSALCSLIYAPLKIAYASGGLVISGLAWAWTGGDTYVSGPIFRSAIGGDYVVTPRQLEGKRSLHFVGPVTG